MCPPRLKRWQSSPPPTGNSASSARGWRPRRSLQHWCSWARTRRLRGWLRWRMQGSEWPGRGKPGSARIRAAAPPAAAFAAQQALQGRDHGDRHKAGGARQREQILKSSYHGRKLLKHCNSPWGSVLISQAAGFCHWPHLQSGGLRPADSDADHAIRAGFPARRQSGASSRRRLPTLSLGGWRGVFTVTSVTPALPR